MTEAVIGLAGGILLAFRFKVGALLPAMLLAAVVIGIGGINWPNAGRMLLTSAAIQVGYFSGLLLRSPRT
jgi:hypothetical protein